MRSAQAIDVLPGQIQDAVGLDCAPACILCHTTADGGAGTATKPFIQSITNDTGDVRSALVGIGTVLVNAESRMTDADHDGVTDVQELRDETDPNSADNGPLCPEIFYGCGASAPPEQDAATAALLDPWAVLVTGLTSLGLFWRRRRR